jgi:hypothetical protein
MQQTSLGKMARFSAAVFVLICSLALLACPGDDEEVRDLNAVVVPANATTVASVQNQDIVLPRGTVFSAGDQALTMRFTSASTATLSRGNSTSTATMSFASCTIVVTQAGGPVPPGTYFFPTCNFQVTAEDLEVDGDEEVGMLTLVLVGATGSVTSNPMTVEVRINSDGVLVVNDVTTNIDTDVASGVTSN